MGNVLIFTNPGDVHACCVDFVLSCMGANSILFNTMNAPAVEPLVVDYTSGNVVIGGYSGHLSNIRSSWNRRIGKVFSLSSSTHPSDEGFIQNNTSSTLSGVLALLDRGFAVNPIVSVRIISNKLIQLDVAAACGFRIPKTLISNSTHSILSFIESVPDACVKPYHAQTWQTDKGYFQSLTARISRDTIENLSSLEVCPHIYQEMIQKKAEYRVTVFGSHYACLRIDSEQLDGDARSDWRASPAYTQQLSPHKLPDTVIIACRRMLDTLGLRFGVFDLAETQDGDFVFFEVNESGQWLWQELNCPECRILEQFCAYLISGDGTMGGYNDIPSSSYDAATVYHAVKSMEKYSSILQLSENRNSPFFADERG